MRGSKRLWKLGAITVLVVSTSAFGQSESEARHNFWVGTDIGWSQLKRTYTVSPSTSESKSSFRLRAGYSPNPRLLLGLELGGWNIESTDEGNILPLPDPNPTKGEGIQTFFAVVRYFPLERSLVFVEGGLGYVDYWNYRPLEHGANGSGAFLGVGRDFPLSERWSWAPSIDYSWGHFNGVTSPPGVTQDERYRAVTLRIGATFRFRG